MSRRMASPAGSTLRCLSTWEKVPGSLISAAVGKSITAASSLAKVVLSPFGAGTSIIFVTERTAGHWRCDGWSACIHRGLRLHVYILG